MVGPRLDEEDAGALVLRQACGQDASRRPAAHDDDVVGGGRRPHDRHQLCSLGHMIVMTSVSSTWRTKMYLSSRPSERSGEHTYELKSLMIIQYDVFCLI